MKTSRFMLDSPRASCPVIYLNGTQIPQAKDAKYLGMQLDRRLNWEKHICSKRKHFELKLSKMY